APRVRRHVGDRSSLRDHAADAAPGRGEPVAGRGWRGTVDGSRGVGGEEVPPGGLVRHSERPRTMNGFQDDMTVTDPPCRWPDGRAIDPRPDPGLSRLRRIYRSMLVARSVDEV